MKVLWLLLNSIFLLIGCCGAPLIIRLYYTKGGNLIWFQSWLETAAFPIILFPLLVNYTRRRGKSNPRTKFFIMKPRLFLAAALVGIMNGAQDYCYAYGLSKLPVSTSALIVATQLAFMAGFAFLLVKQKFTAYSINAVVLLTVAAAVLALHTNSDRPVGESNEDYWIGFVITILAAMLYGLELPLVELAYTKAQQEMTYTLVLEFQLVLCIFSTAFCTVGMIASNGFQKIHADAMGFELGATKYYLVNIFNALLCQSFILGAIGVIFYSSSLFSGVMLTFLLPFTEILAVIFFHDKFGPEKGVSLFLSIWGFISYSYGDYKLRGSNSNNNLPPAEA